MWLRLFILSFLAWLVLPAGASSENLKLARILTGYAEGDAPEWDPMSEVDRSYVGPTRAEPGQWFLAKPERPPMVASLEDLQRMIYDMSYTLEKSAKLKVAAGVLPRDIRKWLRRLNTSIYGQFTLEVKDGQYTLRCTYTPEARMMAAFRNPAMEGKLEGKEGDALEICAWWICGNITRNMPNGLKLKRIHDALIDTAVYSQGKHSVTDMLLKGQGSCVAYTAALQLMLHMMKIDCRRVYGTDEMNHVWNLVELNDEWYHIDMSWNDPVSSVPLRMYNYYLLTDAEMECDHVWQDSEIYAESPQMNMWHHPMRNDIRRSWIAGSNGYTLPNEDKEIPAELYNMYVRQAGDRLEQLNRASGLNIGGKKNWAERFLMKDKQARSGRKKVNAQKSRIDKKRSSRAVEKAELSSASAEDRTKAGAKSEAVTDEKEFDREVLKLIHEAPRLVIPCKETVEPWRLREIVGKSDIHHYAQHYNVIYDELQNTITLDIIFWPYIRILQAATNPKMEALLNPQEKTLLQRCVQNASKLRKPGTLDKKIEEQQQKLPLHMLGQTYGKAENTFNKAAAGGARGELAQSILDRADITYITLQLADIPCTMVYGRKGMVETSWLHLRVDQREWYHYGAKSGSYAPYATDEDMHNEYAWDAEEIPVTPTNAECQAKKNLQLTLTRLENEVSNG